MKKKFTLAERLVMTKELCNAATSVEDQKRNMLNGVVDGLGHSMAVLHKAKQNGLYGKRAVDMNVVYDGNCYRTDGVVGKDSEDFELDNDVFDAESKTYDGDNEAESRLRTFKFDGKYGKRCTDINLDA